jgi:hypothetical protein
VTRLETELTATQHCVPALLSEPERQRLLALGADLQLAWDHPKASPETRKRILRTTLREILVCVQDGEIQLVLHWQGGDHTALALPKNKSGEHRWKTDARTEQLIASLSRQMPDFSIAALLNRLGIRSSKGHTWMEERIRSFRPVHRIAVYRRGERAERGEFTLNEAASELGGEQDDGAAADSAEHSCRTPGLQKGSMGHKPARSASARGQVSRSGRHRHSGNT